MSGTIHSHAKAAVVDKTISCQLRPPLLFSTDTDRHLRTADTSTALNSAHACQCNGLCEWRLARDVYVEDEVRGVW